MEFSVRTAHIHHVCAYHCTQLSYTVLQKTPQNSYDNLHHSSDLCLMKDI